MNEQARAAIRAAYLDGADTPEVAAAAGVTPGEAETYLHWWCGNGCPGAFEEDGNPVAAAGEDDDRA